MIDFGRRAVSSSYGDTFAAEVGISPARTISRDRFHANPEPGGRRRIRIYQKAEPLLFGGLGNLTSPAA